MSKKNLSLFCVILLIHGCTKSTQDKNAYFDISQDNSINEFLVLDNQVSIEKEIPIVSAISMAVTDEHNHIYLVDPRTQQVHSFTKELEYRWSIGGKGEGPGTFTGITALFVNNDELYIYDMPRSVINLYNNSGILMDEWSFHEAGHLIQNIQRTNDKHFIACGYNQDDSTIVNVYSTDFKEKINQIIPIDEVTINNGINQIIKQQIFTNYPGSILPIEDDIILYTPYAYSGEIFAYKKENNNWNMFRSLSGYDHIQEPLTIHFSSDDNHERSLLSGYNPNGDFFHTEFNSMSHGLYLIDKYKIAHLSLRFSKNNTWNLVLEYFDSTDFSLINYTIINNFILDPVPQILPIWMNDKKQIFLTENSDTPLRIFSIEIE